MQTQVGPLLIAIVPLISLATNPPYQNESLNLQFIFKLRSYGYVIFSLPRQAADLLIKNLKAYENTVNKYVTYSQLNQNQFDALVSFTYNCGAGALQKSTLLQKLNQGNIQGAVNEFDRWNKAAEKKLFLSEIESPKEDKELAGVVSQVIK